MRHSLGLGVLLGTAWLSGPALGDDPPGGGAPTIEEALKRIQLLEQDKGQMQEQIADLRRRLGDNWLTEERAREIRRIVEDALADADTRASMLQDGATAGWDGHFFLASADGRFRLEFGGLLQVRWNWNFHDEQDRYKSGFENTRTKVIFDGHMFSPDLAYRIQGDFARDGGNFVLEDAWVRYIMNNEWSARLGQFKLPFNREELVADPDQQVVERSLVNESLNLGWSQGFEMLYADNVTRFAFAFSDGGTDNVGGFGLIGSTPQNSPALAGDTEFAFTARWEDKIAGTWQQFEQFTSPPGDGFGLLVGFAGHGQWLNPGVQTSVRDDTLWLAFTSDVSVAWGGSNLFASFTWEYIDDRQTSLYINVAGLVVQGGTYFTEKLEGFARFEWGRFLINGDGFQDDLWLLTLGGNYYFDGQDVKFTADVGFGFDPISAAWDSDIAGWRQDGPDTQPQVVIRTQFQLVF